MGFVVSVKNNLALDTMVKIRQDSLDLFLAQSVEKERYQMQGEGMQKHVRI